MFVFRALEMTETLAILSHLSILVHFERSFDQEITFVLILKKTSFLIKWDCTVVINT